MLSFQRFLSLVEVDQPTYDYKDIYTYQGIHCVFRTNSEKHQEKVFRFFQYHYYHCSDHQDIFTLYSKHHYKVYSFVEERTYLRLLEWIEEILLLRVGYFDDDIAEITFSDGGIVVDRQRKVVLCYDQSLEHIYFVSDGSDPSVAFELLQTIRELFAGQLEQQGYYLLQASAVEKEGKAIVFCGGEGAGKTTLLLGLLERGYRLISDDKVFVGIEDRKVKVIAWPGAVGVTLATTMHFNPLIGIYADLGSMFFPQHRIHSLAFDQLEENEIDKIDLSIEETVLAFETKFVREVELGQLIVIDDFMPYENFQPVQDTLQSIHYLKQHFYFPQRRYTPEPWSESTFPDWFHTYRKPDQTNIGRFDLTVKILANLSQVKKMNKDRFQTIEKKIDLMEKNL